MENLPDRLTNLRASDDLQTRLTVWPSLAKAFSGGVRVSGADADRANKGRDSKRGRKRNILCNVCDSGEDQRETEEFKRGKTVGDKRGSSLLLLL